MKTVINNSMRVYQVVTSSGKQFFCNIEDVNYVVNSECKPNEFKVYHFWNNKPQLLSKKALDEMFEGLQLKRAFDYKSK
jgi:hypothetical protein